MGRGGERGKGGRNHADFFHGCNGTNRIESHVAKAHHMYVAVAQQVYPEQSEKEQHTLIRVTPVGDKLGDKRWVHMAMQMMSE